MPYTTPLYERGNTAYLRESAARGFLESHTIEGISHGANGWIYTVALYPKTPVNAPHYGERRSMVNGAVIYFEECEFTDLCTALSLAETYHVNQLNAIRAKMSTHCNIGTSG